MCTLAVTFSAFKKLAGERTQAIEPLAFVASGEFVFVAFIKDFFVFLLSCQKLFQRLLLQNSTMLSFRSSARQIMLIFIIADPDEVYHEKSIGRLQPFIKTFLIQIFFPGISLYHFTTLRTSRFLLHIERRIFIMEKVVLENLQ